MSFSHAMKLMGVVCLAIAGLMFSTSAPAQTKKPAKTAKTGGGVKDKPGYDVLANSQGAEQVGFINELIEKMWKDNKIEPSERCSDYEFIRRASLDIIGRIAKPHEIQKFIADPPRDRRSLLVERLLNSEEYG